ncbi:MAG: VPDSG-CTERM sorting domain-containing protein [Limisphaerales bacterium]
MTQRSQNRARHIAAGIALGAAALSPQNTEAITMGTAGNFAVLGGTTVINTGPSTIDGGDVGVSPGSAIVGFPPGSVSAPYTIHAGNAVALQAQTDLVNAYNEAAGLTPSSSGNLTGQDLGGLTLTPGVYNFSSSAQLTGTLTLDFLGNPDAEFVFQIGSTLTTASGSSIAFINTGTGIGEAAGCDLFWQVGSSATLGTGSAFAGHILALTSISLTTGASLTGSALARNGAVTLDNNVITSPICYDLGGSTGGSTGGTTGGSTGGTTGGGTSVPDAGSTVLLMGCALAPLLALKRRFLSVA